MEYSQEAIDEIRRTAAENKRRDKLDAAMIQKPEVDHWLVKHKAAVKAEKRFRNTDKATITAAATLRMRKHRAMKKLGEQAPFRNIGTEALTPLLQAINTGDLKVDEKFGEYVKIAASPEHRALFTTMKELADHLEVSVQVLDAWSMTAQTAKAIEIQTMQRAKLAMPEVLDAMVMSAKGGDAKAAKVVMEVAKMGEPEKDKAPSQLDAMQAFVMGRMAQAEVEKAKAPKTITQGEPSAG